GAVIASGPVAELRDLHARTRVRGVNEAAVADVQADVAETAEEDEVARLQRPAADPPADVEVCIRAVGQLDPEALVDVPDKTGAVEAARAGAAPAVRDTEETPRVGDSANADPRGRHLLEAEPASPLHVEAKRLALHLRLGGDTGRRPEDEGVGEDERKQQKSQGGGHEEELPSASDRRRRARRGVVGQAPRKQRPAGASMGPPGRCG